MDLIRRIIDYKNRKNVRAGMSSMQINQALAYDQSDCQSCNTEYDWAWVQREGYGTPAMLMSMRTFGWNNPRDDFLVTYIR